MNPNNNKTAKCNEGNKDIPIPAPHPAQKFAGIYELAEIDNPDFKPGDLLRYEHCDNYEIITFDENKIWFSDLAEVFVSKGIEIFTLDKVKKIHRRNSNAAVVVKLQNEKLVVMEIDTYYKFEDKDDDDDEIDRRTHEITRVHKLSEDYLVVIEKDSWSKYPATCKKYARVNE